MRLFLADHVHGAVVEGDLVLLDVAADAYFCLPAGDHTLTLDGRMLDATPDALGVSLYEAGLAKPMVAGPKGAQAHAGEHQAVRLTPPRRTARAWLDAEPQLARAPMGWRHLVALARAAVSAHRAEHRAFAVRLADLGAPDPSLTPALLRDLAIFRRLSPWLPLDGACLFRSQMLRAYLAALGHGVSWRFGVRTWPFRAHCWLQVEDLALDDEAERLAAFHPIMAV